MSTSGPRLTTQRAPDPLCSSRSKPLRCWSGRKVCGSVKYVVCTVSRHRGRREEGAEKKCRQWAPCERAMSNLFVNPASSRRLVIGGRCTWLERRRMQKRPMTSGGWYLVVRTSWPCVTQPPTHIRSTALVAVISLKDVLLRLPTMPCICVPCPSGCAFCPRCPPQPLHCACPRCLCAPSRGQAEGALLCIQWPGDGIQSTE